MEKEYIAGEPQRYEIGGRVFIVEPRYRKDGESMADILLKLMLADLDEEMRVANKTITENCKCKLDTCTVEISSSERRA